MNNYDLSILIPARNEMFLAKTVERLLQNIRGNTEILVGLDGEWANPVIQDDPRVTIVFYPQSIGQRAMTNQLCKLSKAKYVMKLDAHCELDEGFDVVLINDMQDDWTMLPVMRNLHAFDWVCIGQNPRSGKKYLDPTKGDVILEGCGFRHYQGPTMQCEKCGGNMERVLMWIAKRSPQSTSFRFDKELHFQYFGEYKKVQEAQGGDIVETMSAQGSCFLLTRQKYWELDICDEGHGSWGQQGTEVACKTWLSGGRLVVNKKTYYAHMFRTQGGDFGFPYPHPQSAVDKAREYSKNLWLKNSWPKAIHPLEWLIEKFKPVPGWHDGKVDVNIGDMEAVDQQSQEATDKGPSKGIIFYTDNRLNHRIAHKVQNQLRRIGLPIVSASLKPMPHFGQKNIHLPLERGVETYFKQIIAALEASDSEIIFFCEHDVIYHPSHFDFTPKDKHTFYYNQNFWRIRQDGFAVHWDASQVSGLVCYRDFALGWFREKLAQVQRGEFDRSYEPGGRNGGVAFKSEFPNVDIRHDGTLTKSKWSPNDFRDKSTCVNWQESDIDHIPGWDGSLLRSVFPQ